MHEEPTLTLTLDGEPLTIEGRPETLGDLLAIADTHSAGHGRIVTALRLDGDDEPAFRESQVVARPVSTLRAIEIESGTPAALALRCLSEAGAALQALADAGGDVAWRLRAGDIQAGNRDLAAITQGIATVLTITGAASLGLGIDLGACETPHGTLSAIAARAANGLEGIIAAQLIADWTAVADRLDADLIPTLRIWGEICGQLDLGPDATPAVSRLQIPDPVR